MKNSKRNNKKIIDCKRECTLDLNRNQTEQWMPKKKESYEKKGKNKKSAVSFLVLTVEIALFLVSVTLRDFEHARCQVF